MLLFLSLKCLIFYDGLLKSIFHVVHFIVKVVEDSVFGIWDQDFALTLEDQKEIVAKAAPFNDHLSLLHMFVLHKSQTISNCCVF